MEKSVEYPFVCGYSPDFWRTLINNLVLDFVKMILLPETDDFPFDHRCILFPFTVIYLLAYPTCVVSIACTILEFPTRNANSIASIIILEILFLYLLIRFPLCKLFQIFFQFFYLVESFPWKVEIISSKMSIGCRLFIDWTAKSQHLNNSCWSQSKFFSYHIYQTFI